MINIEDVTGKSLETPKAENSNDEKIVANKNKSKNYDFDPLNDVQIVQSKDRIHYSVSINANIPKMLNRNIRLVRVILSRSSVNKIKRTYKSGEIIDSFYFNVYDYYSLQKKDEILKTRRLSTICLSNHSNSVPSFVGDNNDMMEIALQNRSCLGDIFNKNNSKIKEYFTLSRNKTDNNIIEVFRDTALMTHTIKKNINLVGPLYVKIIELSSDPVTNAEDDIEYMKYASINDFIISDFSIINNKFINISSEINNKISANVLINKTTASHELTVLNKEENGFFNTLEKLNVEENFEKVNVLKTERISEHTKKIKNSNPTIYRVVDEKQKMYDVFVGDVRKHFFESNPIIHVFSLDGFLMISIKNIPTDYSHFIAYRYEETKKSNKRVVQLASVGEIKLFNNKSLLLKDVNVKGNKTYGYQLKFFTKNGSEILSNMSNRVKFIKPSDAFSLTSEIVDIPGQSDIAVFYPKVPETDSEKIWKVVRDKFPTIDENTQSNLVDNFSYLPFVKLKALDLKTGNVISFDTKPLEDGKIEFLLDEYGLDSSYHVLFGEMFANSIISIIENINSSARYQSPKGEYIPPITYKLEELNLDPDNFLSKFTSFSSISEGTLTYARALAYEPGNIIESAKTGITEIVNVIDSQQEETGGSFDVNITINNRNIPTIKIRYEDSIPDSILIVASSESGINFRTEKVPLLNDKITFYDYSAKDTFLNEIIDYFIIPVYNNYNIGTIKKIGTVICSKDNFRSI